MEFKGTKGSWVIDDNYEGMVLTCSGAYKPNAMLQTLARKDELIANAKLIAAAPDLLEALQDLLKDIKVDNYNYRLATMNKVEQAINKALKS